MSTVLVTGSTGNVGAEVVAQLLERGVPVRATVRPGRGNVAVAATESVEFDFTDAETFAGTLDGVDSVFLVRPPHMSDSKAMRPFIDAMRDARIGHVVFLSVQGAGSNPFVPHHGIEQYLKKSGLAWTFLRPSFFMQNLSTTHCADIREHDEIYVPAGNGRTNFIDVADISEAAAVCLTTPGHGGTAHELTGSEALTYAQVAQVLSETCGRPIAYPKPSASEFTARMRSRGHDDEFIGVMKSIYALAKFGMAAGTTDEFERLVGRKPRTFAEWAARNAACFERNPADG